MTKPLNTQNKWIILTLIGAVAGFFLVSLHVKEKYTIQAMNQSSLQRNPYCYSWHDANIRGFKLEIKINLSKSKVKLQPYSKSITTTECVISPLFKINMHHQMWNRAPPRNQYAPSNSESPPYSKSICTTCQDLNNGPSTCKLSVRTTTPPVLDTILIEQQAVILPR